MKKIFAFILCLMLVCVTPLVAFAEDAEVGDVYEGEVSEGETTPETETPVEEEIQPPVETPEETPEETPPVTEPPVEETPTETPDIKEEIMEGLEEEEKLEIKAVTAEIVKYIEDHLEEISVIITLVLTCFYQMRKHKLLNKSMGVLNNNAITVAKNSSEFMSQALSNIEDASGKVTSYDARIVALLEAFKSTADDKAKLEKELVELKNYLETSTQANMEFANELAELLALANIPNYKKEEIGARHLAAKRHIEEAAAKAVATLPVSSEEVKADDGEKA